MLYFGTHEYGPVHQVPGIFHVATRFFHVYFLPVFPLGSVLVIHPNSNGGDSKSIPIKWNGKSVFFAWLRAAFLLGGIGACVAAMEMRPLAKGAIIDWPEFWGKIASAAALFFVWWRSYRWTHANKETAIRICDQNGIGYPIRTIVEHVYFADDEQEPRADDSADRGETTRKSLQFRLEDIDEPRDAKGPETRTG